ncbi:uncharacterized protein LOC135483944 [Lineus longissimus]|uniref:uncharacterized protein LOC135483944 n=1 Tax=Lineus longissimus TaxID=88925 RepID=UPI00315D91BD
MGEPPTLQSLCDKRKICRGKYTRQENTVTRYYREACNLYDKGDRVTQFETAVRKTGNAMEELNAVYGELKDVQTEVDFHPDLGKLNDEALRVETESEERYRTQYYDISAMVQQLQADAEKERRTPSEKSSDTFTPEHFAAAMKETLESVQTGISGDQLERILGTLSHKKRYVQIPKFKGDVELFDQWKQLVETELEKPGYSEVEKTHIVISLVDGEVSKLISGLKDPSSDDILEFLENRYGDVLTKIQKAVNEIAAVPAVSSPSAKDLDSLYNLLNSNWNYIMKRTEDDKHVVRASWIFTALVRPKLPKGLLKKWDGEIIKEEKSMGTTSELPIRFDTLLEKLQDAVKVARRTEPSKRDKPEKEKEKEKKWVKDYQKESKKPTGHALQISQRTPKPNKEESCIFCQLRHFSSSCPTVKSMPVSERVEKVKASKACFNCLRTTHFVDACRSSSCKNCSRKHHTLLHFDKQGGNKTGSNQETSSEKETSGDGNKPEETVKSPHYFVKARETDGEVLLQTGLAKLESRNAVAHGRVLFDSGSGATFVSKRMARSLQLHGQPVAAEFTLAGGKVMTLDTQRVKFHLSSILPKWKGETFEIIAYVLENPCADINEVNEDLSKIEQLRDLQIADEFPRKRQSVDVLLGIQDSMKILQDKRVFGSGNSLSAQRSHIGWIVSGTCPADQESHTTLPVNHSTFQLSSEIDIATKHWETEHIGILPNEKNQHLSELETEALRQHKEKTIKIKDGYETGLLKHPEWKDKILKSNKQQAMRRLGSLEQRLKKDPTLSARYQEQINELIKKGRAERVSEEKEPEDRSVWYLPHHPVVREDKTTTKVRIVFDGSMRGRDGVSLNDTLLPGPALQPDLPGVLMRFRRHRIALIADIEKMFLQVSMNEIDRDSQRFLWRDLDTDKEPEVFRLTTVTFGLTSSPFSSIKTVLDHVAAHREEYPKAAAEIEENIFVDDILSGDEEDNEVAELAVGLKEILSPEWNMRKFLSNKPGVLSGLAKEDIASELTEKMVGEEISTKALGVRYRPKEDVLMFSFVDKMEDVEIETRRSVLKQLHRIYDPLGMLSPFVLKAKQIFQQSWVTTGGWDDALPSEIEEEWKRWKSEVTLLDSIKIPRCIVPADFQDPVYFLHGFGDACETSYGGVVYLTSQDSTERRHVALLSSKTRVAPLGKRRSIPELELMASLVTARLTKYVERELKLPIASVNCWTDSKVVTHWLSKPPYKWQTFVANRVAEIQNLVPPCNWRHVPGKWNPADLCSRGLTAENLVESSLWWNGPSFLTESEEQWPEQEKSKKEDEEIADSKAKPKLRQIGIAAVAKTDIAAAEKYIEKFSSYQKFIRVMSRARSWIRIHRSRKEGRDQNEGRETDKEKSIPGTTLNDRRQEELHWIRWAQSLKYQEDIEELKAGRQVTMESKLAPLSPEWDEKDQVMRVGGRLHYAPLPEETKHPIILPAHNRFVDKLVLYYHQINLHTGPAQTLAFLRNKCWLIHGRQEVRRILHKCKACKDPEEIEQKMAPLPVERVSMSLPFTHIGLDYAGPLYVKMSRDETTKAYILIFTCMVTRGVHLELTPDLTTEEFMAGLQRMMNRKGKCVFILSDNAKTFKKADTLLRILYKQKNGKNKLNEEITGKGITWRFITERAPWHGGFYERLVQSVKKPLRRVLGKAHLTYLEMQTVLSDIEAQLNSRPLTSVSADKEDWSPITPGHLMIGRSLQVLPDASLAGHTTVAVSKRWAYNQHLSRIFWNRWTKEYLTELNQLRKWTEVRDNLHEGDVVLVAEDNTRKLDWKLGRVEEIFPGRDGLVRSVLVKTKSGLMRRPVQKLRLLETTIVPEDVESDSDPD